MATDTAPDSGGTAAARAISAVTVENATAVAALLRLERMAIGEITGPLRRKLNNVFRRLAGRYVLMFGSLTAPADPERAAALSQLLITELEDLRSYDPTELLIKYAGRASALGARYANRYLADPVPVSDLHPDPVLDPVLDRARLGVDRAVTAAQQYSEQAVIESWDDVVTQMGKANQVATGLDRNASWVVASSHNDSIGQVAAARDAQLLWVAEPDACVVCLALSGTLSDPMAGVGFDEEATFGKPGSAPDVWPPGTPLMSPPRHVNCRCVLELWQGPALAPGGLADTSLYNRPDVAATVDLPAALRREAKRSIVYGWSVPSESNAIRLDAANRLLAKGAGLPKTVEARGRAAVKASKFDNRVHPSHRRTAHRPT